MTLLCVFSTCPFGFAVVGYLCSLALMEAECWYEILGREEEELCRCSLVSSRTSPEGRQRPKPRDEIIGYHSRSGIAVACAHMF